VVTEMDAREKKTLSLFVILVSTIYTMLETPEAKREFIHVIEKLKQKAESELK
jgi:hypothetical protein